MKWSEKRYHRSIRKKLDAIKTRKDLADYLYDLSAGYDAGYMGEQSMFDYVRGAAGFTKALDSYCKDFDLECPDQPDWRWIGRIFMAAFQHS